jgi:sulfatase maturation enzyme AslB (radical SAM superfamily)
MIQLQIETINVCQAACVFCPYPKQERKHALMSMGLYKKIIDEAADIPLIDAVTITGLGETLLDPNIFERIEYIREKMGERIRTDVYTNGHLLTVDKANRFAKAGLNLLYISMNAIEQRKRKEMMGLDDYERVEATVKEIIATNKSKMQVIVKAVMNKDLWEGGDIDLFMEKWGGSCKDGGHAFVHLEGNWAGKNYKVRTTQRQPCSRALGSIMILSNGQVCLCCQDYEGEVIFGDLNTQTLKEIYSSEKFVKYREDHIEGKRSELFLCKDCTMV